MNSYSIDRNENYADLFNNIFYKGILDEENLLYDMERDQYEINW